MPFGWEQVSRDSDDYLACKAAVIGAFSLVGSAVGSIPTAGIGAPAGLLAGAVWGMAASYLACPYLPPLIKKKLEVGENLTNSEVELAVDALAKHTGLHSADEGVHLLAKMRPHLVRKGKPPACHPPHLNAKITVQARTTEA